MVQDFFHQQYLHILTLVSTYGIFHLHRWNKWYFITTVQIFVSLNNVSTGVAPWTSRLELATFFLLLKVLQFRSWNHWRFETFLWIFYNIVLKPENIDWNSKLQWITDTVCKAEWFYLDAYDSTTSLIIVHMVYHSFPFGRIWKQSSPRTLWILWTNQWTRHCLTKKKSRCCLKPKCTTRFCEILLVLNHVYIFKNTQT